MNSAARARPLRKERPRGRRIAALRATKPTPTLCWQCRAVFARGRWTWRARLTVPADICLPTMLCPACRRVLDRDPAHVIRVEGIPPARARDLAGLARHVEAAERSSHPQERIVSIEAAPRASSIGTTGVHLARRLVAAILRSWKHQVAVLRASDSATRLHWQNGDASKGRSRRSRRSGARTGG